MAYSTPKGDYSDQAKNTEEVYGGVRPTGEQEQATAATATQYFGDTCNYCEFLKMKVLRVKQFCPLVSKRLPYSYPTFAAHSTDPRTATTQAQQPELSPDLFAQSVYA